MFLVIAMSNNISTQWIDSYIGYYRVRRSSMVISRAGHAVYVISAGSSRINKSAVFFSSLYLLVALCLLLIGPS